MTALRTPNARWRKAVIRVLALAAKPVRKAQGSRGTVVEPYRGYGSYDEIFLIGRVFRQSHPDKDAQGDDIRTHLRDIGRRIRRRKVAGVTVAARFNGAETRVATDRDGYFRVTLHPGERPPQDVAWHAVDLSIETDPPVQAFGQVYIPPVRCRFVVISDIDDTIMHTGVANKLKMLWRLFVSDADSRVAFPGAAALCRALHAGATGDQDNPMLYVSRAPWGIYDMLTEFFRLHAIPVGPVLFLREWGLSWRHPLPRRAEDHKRDLIRHMLALYRDLPFVLIGDSGQHDPEVYAEIVAEHPGRVLAVYIRNVSHDAARLVDIARLAEAVTAAGSSLVLAADSAAIAAHAVELGLIAAEACGDVSMESTIDRPAGPIAEPHRFDGPAALEPNVTPSGDNLTTFVESGRRLPPNLVVQSADRR